MRTNTLNTYKDKNPVYYAKYARNYIFPDPYFPVSEENLRFFGFCPYTGKCGSEETRALACFTKSLYILRCFFVFNLLQQI